MIRRNCDIVRPKFQRIFDVISLKCHKIAYRQIVGYELKSLTVWFTSKTSFISSLSISVPVIFMVRLSFLS